jgi:hypothetical protein
VGYVAVVRGGGGWPGLRGRSARAPPAAEACGDGTLPARGCRGRRAPPDGLPHRRRAGRPPVPLPVRTASRPHRRGARGGTGGGRAGAVARHPRPHREDPADPHPGAGRDAVRRWRGGLVRRRDRELHDEVRRQGLGLRRRHPAAVGRVRLDDQPEPDRERRRQPRRPQPIAVHLPGSRNARPGSVALPDRAGWAHLDLPEGVRPAIERADRGRLRPTG